MNIDFNKTHVQHQKTRLELHALSYHTFLVDDDNADDEDRAQIKIHELIVFEVRGKRRSWTQMKRESVLVVN